MKLSKPQSITIFALFLALIIGFVVWQQTTKPQNQVANQDTTPEERDIIVEQLLEENQNLDEDKFCMTVSDCAIVTSGDEDCPREEAFYKDAIDAHRQFIENIQNGACPGEAPSSTAQIVCQDHQCQIEYSE